MLSTREACNGGLSYGCAQAAVFTSRVFSTFHQTQLTLRPPCSSGGVIMRRRMVEQVRRLRCGSQPRSGGPGVPSAPTTRSCLQWLDVVRMKAAKAAGSGSNPVRARKHGSGAKSRRKSNRRLRKLICEERRRARHRRGKSRTLHRAGCPRCARRASHACPVQRDRVGAPFGAPLPRDWGANGKGDRRPVA